MKQPDPWDAAQYARNASMQFRQACEALQHIDITGFNRVLDIGCGDGAITRHLSEQAPSARIVGVDSSASMSEFAQRTHAQPQRREFRQMSADSLEFDDEFDRVCSFSVLHWVKRQWAAWKGIHRALKNRGRVLVGFQVDHDVLWDAVSAVGERDRWKPLLLDFDDPYNHWDREFMIRCIRGNGFYIDRFDDITADELFGTRQALADFIASWLPLVRQVPTNVRQDLMDEILDVYYAGIESELAENSGIRIRRYILQAWKG